MFVKLVKTKASLLRTLQNRHEHGTMDNIMTLLTPLNSTSLLTPYEQSFVQSLHQQGKLITEQEAGEHNPLFQLIIDPTYKPLDTSRPELPTPTT